jgi:phosphoribosylformylglycinamidine synthase
VSFYNETFGEDIYPTPVLGMVGLIEDVALVTRAFFKDAGDDIVLIETVNLQAGKVNLEDERAVQNLIAAAIRDKLIKSAHDVGEGGLAVALAECCYSNLSRGPIGAAVQIPSHELEVRKDLFGEATTRVLLTTTNPAELMNRASTVGLNARNIGKVGGNTLILNYEGQRVVELAVDELETVWRRGLQMLLS